ncbi:MAG: hypothetical protein HY812_22170 [Planctomycetes bacterium]|nr:hypothetical protein [Planctomycetota bacterium]
MARFSLAHFSLLAVSLALAPAAAGQGQVDPTLTVNGVTSSDNSAVPHLTKYQPLTIAMTGTPLAPFALLMSGDAYDGTASVPPEPNITDGFFLKPWTPVAGVFSPIHPVFDGIGMAYIEAHLADYSPVDFLPDTASPIFRFDASGNFTLHGITPPIAYLADLNATPPNGPTDPIVLPLESVPPTTVALYLQIVSLDMVTLGIREGNGMKVIFDEVVFPGSVAYCEGQSVTLTTYTLGSEQSLGTLVHTDMSAGNPQGLTAAPEFSANGFPGQTDIWMITLAGAAEVSPPSLPPNGDGGEAANPVDPDVDYNIRIAQGYYSDIEVFTHLRPARNNENFEYPRIALPGNRELFHWRKGIVANPALSEYGFGVLFKDTNTFRNLTPAGCPSGPFTESATRSPWEVEVGVSPDGDRAVAILDKTGTSYDRVFLLNLEPGGVFSNGWPVMEATNPSTSLFARIFDESISFVSDGLGGWVVFFNSTNSTSTSVAIYPNRTWRVHADTSVITAVLPSTGLTPARIDRNMHTSADRNVLCVMAGASATAENMIAVTNVTAFGSHTILDITQFPSNTGLLEANDATEGKGSFVHLSKDGSLIAFARTDGTRSFPLVARTDGSTKGHVNDLVTDITNGGLYDTAVDFSNTMEPFLTDDNGFLMFYQGLNQAGFLNDRHDLFVVDLSLLQTRNLTRSITGLDYNSQTSTKAYYGPWDPLAADERPDVDPGGWFLSRDRSQRYVLRDRHGIPGKQGGFNVVGVSVGPTPGGGAPNFNMMNVTGTEFEPYFGGALPTIGAPNIATNVGPITEPTPGYLRLRRVGGAGVLKDFYYFTARLANAVAGEETIEHLFLFDGSNPGPALRISNYGLSSTPIAVTAGTTIENVVPSKVEPKVAYILNRGGAATTVTHEVIVQDLAAYATPVQIPDPDNNPSTPPEFNRLITFGSIHWLSSTPAGLVFAAGSVLRPASSGTGSTDGVGGGDDSRNPINASPYFYSFLEPTFERKLTYDAAGSNRRAVFIWNVK